MTTKKNKAELKTTDKELEYGLNITEVSKKVANKFMLTAAVSKRARQIKDGSKAHISDSASARIPVVAALKELQEDVYSVSLKKAEEVSELDQIEELDSILEEELKEESESDDNDKPDKKSKSRSLAA